MKRRWTLLIIGLVLCGGLALSQSPVVKQIVNIKFVKSRNFVGWVLARGLQGSNQWHITSDKVVVVGKQFGILDPNSQGDEEVYSDYYPPGTRLFKIPGVSTSAAIAVQDPTGSYVLAIHESHGPSINGFDICEGWVVPTGQHSPGHYKVTSDAQGKVGPVIGTVGTNYTSSQVPRNKPVYALPGVNQKIAISVAYPSGAHSKAIWVPDESH